MDCNTPLMVMDKRAETCCGVVAPLLRGIKRHASVLCDKSCMDRFSCAQGV